MSETIVPDQSLRDIQRRRWARAVIPHMMTLPCPMPKCHGLMTFTGRSFQDGIGPLVNIHTCDECHARQDISDDYYPRIEYRNEEGRPINLKSGKAEGARGRGPSPSPRREDMTTDIKPPETLEGLREDWWRLRNALLEEESFSRAKEAKLEAETQHWHSHYDAASANWNECLAEKARLEAEIVNLKGALVSVNNEKVEAMHHAIRLEAENAQLRQALGHELPRYPRLPRHPIR